MLELSFLFMFAQNSFASLFCEVICASLEHEKKSDPRRPPSSPRANAEQERLIGHAGVILYVGELREGTVDTPAGTSHTHMS